MSLMPSADTDVSAMLIPAIAGLYPERPYLGIIGQLKYIVNLDPFVRASLLCRQIKDGQYSYGKRLTPMSGPVMGILISAVLARPLQDVMIAGLETFIDYDGHPTNT